MKRSDISDAEVVAACRDAHRVREIRALDLLVQRTGAPEKVAFRAMERAEERRLIECGVGIATAWPVEREVPEADLGRRAGERHGPEVGEDWRR